MHFAGEETKVQRSSVEIIDANPRLLGRACLNHHVVAFSEEAVMTRMSRLD